MLEPIRQDDLGDRFLAVHSGLQRRVELQIFPAELTADPELRQRLIDKTARVAKLDHPALVHVYDVDQEGGRYFLVRGAC